MEKKQGENGKENTRKTRRNSLTYKLYMREVLKFLVFWGVLCCFSS